jgi:hypothetical protein
MDKEEEGNGRGGKIKREREGYILWSFMLLVYRKEPFCKTYHKRTPPSPIELLLELKIKPFHW